MDRIHGSDTIDIGGGRRGFRDRNLPLAQRGTVVNAAFLNGLQEELVGLIEWLGIAPNVADSTQLRQAVSRLAGGGARSITADRVLEPNDAGVVPVNASGGHIVITLPHASAAAGRPIRFQFARWDSSGNVVTIQRSGSDSIEGTTALTLGPQGRITLVSEGSSWFVFGDGGRVVGTAGAGYVRLAGGSLILQWGSATLPNSGTGVASAAVVFPISFPTAVFGAWLTPLATINSVSGVVPVMMSLSLTTSGFTAQGDSNVGNQPNPVTFNRTVPVRWLAVGM